MSDLINKVKEKISSHEDKKAEPGNNIERQADDKVNNVVNNFANQEGVPQQFDKKVDDAVDQKVNSDIPGGN